MAVQLVHSDGWLDRVHEGFSKALLREELSAKTVRTYSIGIKDLFVYLREQGVDDIHYLSRELLEGWQDNLRERVPVLKASTRGLYGTAVRQLRAAGVTEQAQADYLNHADTRTVHKYAKGRGPERQRTLDVMEELVSQGARMSPQMLARRAPPGGRPRYR